MKETVKFDKIVNKKIAKNILLKNPKKILILGLSYKSDVKVSILSPSIDLYNFFKKKKIRVDIFDPLFKKNELKKILNCRYLNDFNLSNYDSMIFMINHRAFQKTIESKIKKMKNLKTIIDNTAHLKKFEKLIQKKNCELLITGKSNWLN